MQSRVNLSEPNVCHFGILPLTLGLAILLFSSACTPTYSSVNWKTKFILNMERVSIKVCTMLTSACHHDHFQGDALL